MSEAKQARLFSAIALLVAFLGWVRPTEAVNPPVYSRLSQLSDVAVGTPVAGYALTRDNAGKWRGEQGEINVQAFGAKGDGTTDDTAAFQAALTYINSLDTVVPSGNNNHNKGACLYCPRSSHYYRLTGTLHIQRGLTLRGDGGSGWFGCSELRWDGGTVNTAPTATGIVIETNTTSSDGGRGAWSVIRDLIIAADGPDPPTPNAGVYGIQTHATFKLENLYVYNWPSDGVHVTGDVTVTPNTNCNLWHASYMLVDTCGGYGFYVSGHDANAGSAVQVWCQKCAQDGFYDNAGLANSYINCGTATNAGKGFNIQRAATLVNPYAETDQNPTYLGSGALWIGGTPGPGFDPTGIGGMELGGAGGVSFQSTVYAHPIGTGAIGVDLQNPSGSTAAMLRWLNPSGGISPGGGVIDKNGRIAVGSPVPNFVVEADPTTNNDGIGIQGQLANTGGNFAGVFFTATSAQHNSSLIRYTPASSGRLASATQLNGADSSHIILTPGTGGKVLVDGGLGVAGSISAAVSGMSAACLPIYDANGSLLGYIPIYPSHS